MRLRIIIILCLLSLLTAVTDTKAHTIGVHIGSHHFPNEGYNNFNPGAYFKHDNGFTVGAYLNSYRKVSVYAGATYSFGPVDFTIGGITGYQGKVQNGGYVSPLIVPSIALPAVNGISPRIAYLPKVEKGGAHVLHLMLEF